MVNLILDNLKEYLGKTVNAFNLDTKGELNLFFEDDLTITSRLNCAVHHSYNASTEPEYINNMVQSILNKKVEAVTIAAHGDIVLSFGDGFELTLSPKDNYRLSFP